MFLFLAVLLEKTIVFSSQSKTEISNAINTFLSMIKPLNWAHPFIYNLPADCSVMVNSPLPMIIGICMDSQQVFKNIIQSMDSLEDKIVVFLDEQMFYMQESLAKSIVIPSFEEFHEKFKKKFKTALIPRSSSFLKIVPQKSNGKTHFEFCLKNKEELKQSYGFLEQGEQVRKKKSLFSSLRFSTRDLNSKDSGKAVSDQ